MQHPLAPPTLLTRLTFAFEAIGVVRSPLTERAHAPRQPDPSEKSTRGTIELFEGRGFEYALEDLETFDHIWVLFVFHRNVEDERGFRPKVLPPRSATKRGVFGTRSPHRPNPIGMSVLRLEAIEGLTLRVRDLDMLDETPVIDIKPYIPYCDARPGAKSGWLERTAPRDPLPTWMIEWSPRARGEAAWLRRELGVELVGPVEEALALGPEPHPYRRIRVEAEGLRRIAIKEWRVHFRVDGRNISIERISSGFRARERPDAHRAFTAKFGGEV